MTENPIIGEIDKYFHTMKHLGDQSSPLKTPSFAVPRCPKSFLFVFGGIQGRSQADISIYDSRADLWKRADVDLPAPWSYMGSVVHDNKVFMAGGIWQESEDGNNQMDHPVPIEPRNLWKFDPLMICLSKSYPI